MFDQQAYIQSGILELYVLGHTNDIQNKEIEDLRRQYAAIDREIVRIEQDVINYGPAHRISPSVKALLLATIDYTERLKNGEPVTFPPLLNAHSKIEEYDQWLTRPDITLPADADDLFVKIIGYTPTLISAVVWIKRVAEEEIHQAEHEKFLIVEGTCDITIDGKVNHLKPGDFMEIPLHADHDVKVTSDIPCKVILQRAAA